LCPMHAVERAVYFCEIPDMRSVHNCAAQLGSLDWILPAVSDQRAANEHRGRQPIEQAKLANCVRHIDLGRAFGQFSARAEYRVQALRCGELGDAGPALAARLERGTPLAR